MFHSTTILESAVYITCFFLTFTFLDKHYFGKDDFMRKWKITASDAMDIACKAVSAGFAISATLCGIFMLWISPDYDPEVKDRSSFLVDRVMVWAMSYFVYDFFAMYHVYLARKNTTKISDNNCDAANNVNQENLNLSQTTRLEKSLDANHDTNELINSISTHNDNTNGDNSVLSSTNKNILNSNCDKNRRSISEEIGGVSSNGTSNKNAR